MHEGEGIAIEQYPGWFIRYIAGELGPVHSSLALLGLLLVEVSCPSESTTGRQSQLEAPSNVDSCPRPVLCAANLGRPSTEQCTPSRKNGLANGDDLCETLLKSPPKAPKTADSPLF